MLPRETATWRSVVLTRAGPAALPTIMQPDARPTPLVEQEVERVLAMPDGLAPDPNDKDNLGRSAMHLAAWAGRRCSDTIPLCSFCALCLLETKLRPCTDLSRVSWRAGHGAVVKRLAEAGGDVLATAADNVSCLHFACQKGCAGAVAELLTAKADVHAKDQKKKNTPLHVACEKGFIDCIKLLVEAGSNLKEINKAKKTPFDVCKNEEATLALPGGFSRLKGEKANWRETDPQSFMTHQQEVAAKKAEKLRAKLGQGGKAVPDFKPAEGWTAPGAAKALAVAGQEADASDRAGPVCEAFVGTAEEEQADEESAFNVPASKTAGGKKQKRAANTATGEVEDDAARRKRAAVGEAGTSSSETATAAEAAVSTGVESDIGPSPFPSAAGANAQAVPASPAAPVEQASMPTQQGLPGLLASLADLDDMLLDDPTNEDLLEMKRNIEVLIKAQKSKR